MYTKAKEEIVRIVPAWKDPGDQGKLDRRNQNCAVQWRIKLLGVIIWADALNIAVMPSEKGRK